MPDARVDRDMIVGIVGLGSIGLPMAERIASAGWRVVGYDVRPPATVQGRGIFMASAPEEVADMADIVLSCLTSADIHRDAILGSQGIARGRRIRDYVHLG